MAELAAALAGVNAVSVIPVARARPAAAASGTLRLRRRAAAMGGWVTCISPLSRVAAAHVGASGRTGVRAATAGGGITAWPGATARCIRHAPNVGWSVGGIASDKVQPGPIRPLGVRAAAPFWKVPCETAVGLSVLVGGKGRDDRRGCACGH